MQNFYPCNGADEVIYPERQMAERMAKRISANNVFDYIELSDDFTILEVPIRESWVGRTIEDVEVRTKFHINILAVKQNGKIQPIIRADHTFVAGEHLIVFGRKEDLLRFTGKL